ncbi:MAG: hypothetical protein M3Y33_00710 [Actinomycetota bacterium]|nr:hypothetical protein [Actinomycetota bacterium]
MLIALLAVIGVDLIWIVVLIVILLTRRAWVSHQPGAFKGALRVAEGTVCARSGSAVSAAGWATSWSGLRDRRCSGTS